jgi:hypothetical protein
MTSHRQRKERLEFIEGMLKQLETMAKADHSDLLCYLIGMAILEAQEAGQRPDQSGAGGRPLPIRTG